MNCMIRWITIYFISVRKITERSHVMNCMIRWIGIVLVAAA